MGGGGGGVGGEIEGCALTQGAVVCVGGRGGGRVLFIGHGVASHAKAGVRACVRWGLLRRGKGGGGVLHWCCSMFYALPLT